MILAGRDGDVVFYCFHVEVEETKHPFGRVGGKGINLKVIHISRDVR